MLGRVSCHALVGGRRRKGDLSGAVPVRRVVRRVGGDHWHAAHRALGEAVLGSRRIWQGDGGFAAWRAMATEGARW
jgi:hypothetical protein